jgi:MFS transporter, DHA3 family, macrolide efflux protein
MPPRRLSALVVTQIGSTIGSAVSGFALSFWIFQKTGSTVWLSLLLVANSLPGILVGPWAGVVVDRWSRRRVMLLADTVSAAATAIALLLFATGRISTGAVLVLVVILSVSLAFQEPAYGAALPSLAPPNRLVRINSAVSLGMALALVVGPPTGATLLAFGGLVAPLALDLVTFVLAAGVLLRLRFAGDEPAGADQPILQPMRAWTLLKSSPGMLTLLGMAITVNVVLGVTNTLIFPLALGVASDTVAGLVIGAGGVGLLLGGLGASVIGDRFTLRAITAVGLSLCAVGFLVAAFARGPVGVAAGYGLSALLLPAVFASSRAVLQVTAEPRRLGRVLALFRTCALVSFPVGMLLAGPLADHLFGPAFARGGDLAAWLDGILGPAPARNAAAPFLLAATVMVITAVRAGRSQKLAGLERIMADRRAADAVPDPVPIIVPSTP